MSKVDMARVLTAPDGSPHTLIDTHGRTVEMSEILRDRTTIVVLVRHFLCMYCQDYFKQIWNEFKQTDYYQDQAQNESDNEPNKQTDNQLHNRSNSRSTRSSKVQLIVIGSGSPSLGRSLATEYGAEGDDSFALYVDRELVVYKSFDLRRGGKVRFNDVMRGTARALWQGITRCWCMCQSGDVQQQGGVFVIKPTTSQTDQSNNQSLECVFAHIDQDGGDHANTDEVFRAAGIKRTKS